jgi:hypothetical protein
MVDTSSLQKVAVSAGVKIQNAHQLLNSLWTDCGRHSFTAHESQRDLLSRNLPFLSQQFGTLSEVFAVEVLQISKVSA